MGLSLFRLRFVGDINADGQTWSVGLNFRGSDANSDPAGPADPEGNVDQWINAVKALNNGNIIPSALQGIMGSSVRIRTLRGSIVGVDGKETYVSEIVLGTAVSGTSASSMPNQVALAIGLGTGRPGASYRGRVYWPALGISLNGVGRVDKSVRDGIAAGTAGFLHDLANAGSDVLNPKLTAVVYSPTKSIANAITQCAVGDRLDIQRRRADQEKETYSVAAVSQ